MKWFNSILSIYIVILSCLPCTDGMAYNTINDNEVYKQSTISDTHTHTGHSHEDGDEDTCPPFCDCNCCGAQVLTYLPFLVYEFPLRFKKIQSKIIFYKSNLSSTFFDSIWQPPQIV